MSGTDLAYDAGQKIEFELCKPPIGTAEGVNAYEIPAIISRTISEISASVLRIDYEMPAMITMKCPLSSYASTTSVSPCTSKP
eukprot:2465101-Rhodomonas_salina.1